jgi:PKD repeat protein
MTHTSNGNRPATRWLLLAFGIAASAVLLAEPAQARTPATGDPPTLPITDPAPGPPAIPPLPPAGEQLPPGQVGDPITAGAVCGDWHLVSKYGDRWPGTSTWWEYQCTHHVDVYHPHPCPPVGMCEAVCYGYPLDCYWVSDEWTDHFYSDGSDAAVFYGQSYTNTISDGIYYEINAHWWDAAAAGWYRIEPRHLLAVTKEGAGSGTVTSTPSGIDCGNRCEARFDDGAVVTLTATADAASTFLGWGFDCWGTDTCQVTLDRARWVTAHFSPNVKDLTVSPQGTGSGIVTSSPTGVSCGTTCHASFATGATVTLTAVADADSTFTAWSGDCTGTGPCQLTMDRNHWVFPIFTSKVPNEPPTPRFTFICTALTCNFDASSSIDSDGTITSYMWFFGDGTGEGRATATIEHTYRRAGTYQVTLQLTDNRHAQATSPPQTVTLTNSAPTATFTYSCTILTCHFDGRASTDSDGTITSYGWSLGDASPPVGGPAVDHTYPTAGRYPVRLTVVDNGELVATSEHLVEVTTVPGAPLSLSARPIGNTAAVGFSAPLSDGGAPITSYQARCVSSTGGVTRQASGARSPINVPSLTRGKTYTCTVRATNAIGTGPASAPSAPFRVPK